MFRFACCILYLHIKSAAMRACENFCKNSFYNYLHSSTTATPASGGAVATINKLHRFFTGDDHFLRAQLKPQKCKNTSSFWTWKLILVNAISLIFFPPFLSICLCSTHAISWLTAKLQIKRGDFSRSSILHTVWGIKIVCQVQIFNIAKNTRDWI